MKKIIIIVLSVPTLCIIILAVNYIIFEKTGSRISVGEPITPRDTVKKALLVIDVQESITGKLSTNDHYILKSGEMIENINRIIDSAIRKDIPVIYVKNEITNFLLNILNNSLAKGSEGAELDSRLRIASDYIINKDKSDAFSNPALDSILNKNEINKLVFTGVDLAYCVNSTIQAAANRNYQICLVSDALLSKSDSMKAEMLDKYKERGFEIVSGREYNEFPCREP